MNPKLIATLTALLSRGRGGYRAVKRIAESDESNLTAVAAEELTKEAEGVTPEVSQLIQQAIAMLKEGKVTECIEYLEQAITAQTASAAAQATQPAVQVAQATAPATAPAGVPDPALLALLQKQVDQLNASINDQRIESEVRASTLPEPAKARVIESLRGRGAYNPDAVKRAITDKQKELEELGVGWTGGAPRISVSQIGIEDANLALQGFFAGRDMKSPRGHTVRRFKSIKEAKIHGWNGNPLEPTLEFLGSCFGTGYHSGYRRVKEALVTANWDAALSDNMSKVMIDEYADQEWNEWRLVSNIISIPNFKTQNLVRVGGYGEIPTVAEGATYTELTSPTDEAATFSLLKKGGFESVTLEMIANDDMRFIQRIPKNLARSCKIGLYRAVFDLFANNTSCSYDSTALAAAGHANTGTTALSQAALNAARQAMMDQAAYNEARNVLGLENVPKYLLVPSELEPLARSFAQSDLILQTAATSGEYGAGTFLPTAPYMNLHKGLIPLVIPYWDDANNWWLVADPANVPVIAVGFWNGDEEPKLYTEAENSGSVFTADKITYKVQFFWGVCIEDHRGVYGAIVA